MKFSFNFFGTQEIRRFNYRPRFYDPEKEERIKKFGDHKARAKEGESSSYTPGSYVKGSLRDGNYSKTHDVSRNQKLLGMVTTILLFTVIYLIYKYFPLLIQSLGI